VLGIPRATLGRRLARLAARLVRRTTRSLALTDAGEAFHRHALVVLGAVGHAQASVRHTDDAVRGDLRISVPPILTRGFRVMLVEFAKQYPEVRVQIDFSTRLVDLLRGEPTSRSVPATTSGPGWSRARSGG
jgi:DNA-binding transcriptional LysR family regulator